MESITSDRKITCPKCGAENLNWRSRCEKCGGELHQDERKIPKFETRGVGFWFAFFLGIVGLVCLWGLVLFSFALSGYFPLQTVVMLMPPVLGLVLCWKWPRIASIVLIIGGILPLVFLALDVGFDSEAITGYVYFLIGIAMPLIGSGVLFLMRDRG